MKENKISEKIEGTIELLRSGHAHLNTEDKAVKLFVNKKNLSTALNGDEVTASVIKVQGKHGDEVQGVVFEIKKRNQTRFSGLIEINKEKGFAFVKTTDEKMLVDFFIPMKYVNDAQHGDMVVVQFYSWNKKDKNPTGIVKKILGKAHTHEAEMGVIMNKYNIDYSFPDEVISEANNISIEIAESEILKRRDMRDTLTLTIDPDTAKDFDDAISFKILENGNYEIGVHIADVTHYIRPGSELDKEAFRRATSIYLVDRCIPMLPERLSNGVCSLRPHEDKLTFSVIFEINPKGEVVKHSFRKTIINSDHRFTYEEAQGIIKSNIVNQLEKNQSTPFEYAIRTLNDIAKKIRAERFKEGAVTFNSKEPQFILDENNFPVDVFFHESVDSHELIEEYMLLANKYVATYAHSLTRPFVYRTHDLPDEEKLAELSAFAKQFGYEFKTSGGVEQTKRSLNEMLKQALGSGEEKMISTLAIRSMSKAVYSTQVIGHYGLGFKHYSHFTSPIRRYPDILSHRLLWEYIQGKNGNISRLKEECEHCSDMENRAVKAQRESVKYKQCEYMSKKIGEKFVGVISSVTDFGIFVQIIENGCDGLIGKENLSNENLFVDIENFCVNNFDGGGGYRLGDEIMVEVASVSVVKKQSDLKILIETIVSEQKTK